MKQTIKRTLSILLCLMLTGTMWGQAPHLFNYQGIARNAEGNPLANQKTSIKN